MAHIHLRSVSVQFPIFNVTARSFKKDFLRMATGGSIAKDSQDHVVIKALDNISFSLEHGDQVGLIGHNGSGKSTLLRLLATIYEPTHGHMQINGHISAMLDIMQGVESEFTGFENIYTRGILMGLSKRQILRNVDEIADLTGLGDYLHMPVRTYSSGMRVRLAFAISTSIEPEILLIDEVFGAGDAEFMSRARSKMISLLNKSSVVVLATHSNELISEFCNKALLLNNGRVKFFGPVDEALKIYHAK